MAVAVAEAAAFSISDVEAIGQAEHHRIALLHAVAVLTADDLGQVHVPTGVTDGMAQAYMPEPPKFLGKSVSKQRVR